MSLGGVDGANCLTVKHLDGESRPFTAAVITVGSLWVGLIIAAKLTASRSKFASC